MNLHEVHPFWFMTLSLGFAALPITVGLLTSYLKISIVLQFFRAGLGAQQVPSGMVIMLLSTSLTLTIMAPVLEQTFQIASEMKGSNFSKGITESSLHEYTAVLQPWKAFLEKHVGEREVKIFTALSHDVQRRAGKKQISAESKEREVTSGEGDATVVENEPTLSVLLPAFVVSELSRAFSIGLIVLIPMVVIDLIVANILVGMGMFMVSPVMIALPLKLLVFIVADGWNLLSTNLVQSYWGI